MLPSDPAWNKRQFNQTRDSQLGSATLHFSAMLLEALILKHEESAIWEGCQVLGVFEDTRPSWQPSILGKMCFGCMLAAPPAMAILPSLASARQAPRNHPDPCQHLQSGLFSGMVAHLGQQTQEHVCISPGPAPSRGSEKPVDPSRATCASYTAQSLP